MAGLAMSRRKPQLALVDSLIHDGLDIEVHRFTVRYLCDPEELSATLRRAIADFVATSDGQAIARENRGDFNWGDACVEIPNAFWRRYGIVSFTGEDPNEEHLIVEHDENFFERSRPEAATP